MKTYSALLALLFGEFTGEFPTQRPVTRSFDVSYDLRLNKRWANNREAGDLRQHRAHYDVTVMVNDGFGNINHSGLFTLLTGTLHTKDHVNLILIA